jgi:hypothetical protein
VKNLIRIEEALLFLIPLYMAHDVPLAWWWFAVLFFTPDFGILGYAANPKVGAWIYNILHHRGVAVVVFFAGLHLHSPWLQLYGLVMISHASFDRVFGYGLKYTDSFRHTHLGMIGRDPATASPG